MLNTERIMSLSEITLDHLDELRSRINVDKDLKSAIHSLSPYTDDGNNVHYRKSFRSSVKNNQLQVNKNFLDTVRELSEAVNDICSNIEEAEKDFIVMQDEIRKTKQKHSNFIELYCKFRDNKKQNVMKQCTVKALWGLFEITDKEIEEAKNSDVATMGIFVVYEKLQTVKKNCQQLQKAGYKTLHTSTMDYILNLEKSAVNKIYKWALETSSSNIDSTNSLLMMKKVMNVLQSDMDLFNNILDQYCTKRRNALSETFIDFLSRQPYNRKTIIDNKLDEYSSSNDGLNKYGGQTLAWIHQQLPAERESLSSLLNECSQTVKLEKIDSSLSSITSGICNTLRLRIENVIIEETSPVQLYATIELLLFYAEVVSSIISESLLEKTIRNLMELCEACFLKVIKESVQTLLLERMDAPQSNLAPSPGVKYMLNFITELLSTSFLTTKKQHDRSMIMKHTVEPLLHVLHVTSSRLTAADMAIYLLNCFQEIHSTLSAYEFVGEWLDRVKVEIDNQIDTISAEQSNSLVNNLNLASIYSIVQSRNRQPLSQIAGMNQESLTLILDKLYKFVHNPDTYMLPQLRFIASVHHRTDIKQRSKQILIAVYEQLYNSVMDPANLYVNPHRMLPYSPQQLAKRLLNKD